MTTTAFDNPSSFITPLVAPLLKFLLWLVGIVLVVGFVVGMFTYGRPLRKRRKSDGTVEDILDIGAGISHIFIGMLLRTFSTKRAGRATWLDDQQILAMARGMKPSAFEEFVAKIFTALGYKTELVGGSGDGGIDIDMTKNGRHYVVQCKKFITRKVNPHDVRDFFGAMGDRHIDGRGFFVTTNIFTLEAERFAEGKPMELIDGTEFVRLVRESGVLGMATPVTPSAANAQEPPLMKGICPNCGKELVIRTNKTDGTRFFGCTGYPDCRFTKPI